MSTLQTLRDAVRINKQKIDPNGRVWADSEVDTAIKQAVTQIQQDGDYNWHFNDAENSQNTVVSTGTYALPDGFVRIEKGTVKYNGQPLLPRDYGWLKRNNTTLAVDGNSSVYYLRGNNIGLFQRPNDIKVLEFLYRKKLATMAADASDSGMESDFDEAIVQYASYMLWSVIQGRNDNAISAIQNYKQAMEGLNAQYLGRRDDADFSFKFETIQDYSSF